MTSTRLLLFIILGCFIIYNNTLHAQPIYTSGNFSESFVGIGTSNPFGKLHIEDDSLGYSPGFIVNGADNFSPTGYSFLVMGQESNYNVPHVQLTTGSSKSRMTIKCSSLIDKAPRMQFIGPQDSLNPGWAIFDYGSKTRFLPNASFKIRHVNPSFSSVEMLVSDGTEGVYLVPTTGKVGIGTTNPQTELHVDGTIRSTALAGGGLVIADQNGNLVTDASLISQLGNDQDWLSVDDSLPSEDITEAIYTQGDVALGTTNPLANFHVGDGKEVLFGSSPIGPGSKVQWLPNQSAFRAGYIGTNQWDPAYIGQYSVALGKDTRASGTASVSIGNGSISSGDYSVALGDAATAGGDYSLAIGRGASASGVSAVSFGVFALSTGSYTLATGLATNASGYVATALGCNSSSSGSYSFTSGNSCVASADYTTAMGRNAKASSTTAFAVGHDCEAQGLVSTAFGSSTIAQGDYSFTAGRQNTASGLVSTALGRYSTASNSYTTALGYSTTASGLQAVAMGNSSEAFGDFSTTTGLGTRSSYASFALGQYNDDTGLVTAWNPTDYIFTIGDGNSSSSRSNLFYIKKNGDLWTQGVINQASDRRLKKNIKPVKNVLDDIEQLNGVRYQWKDTEHLGEHTMLGLIAQDVEKVYPELIEEVEGYKSVNYIGLIPVLVEGMKDMKTELTVRDERIEAVEQENEDLKDRLEAIEAQLASLNQASHTQPSSTSQTLPTLSNTLPNPFSNQVEIQYYLPQNMNVSLQISDVKGSILHQQIITQTGHGKHIIQSSQWAEGTYICSLILEGNVVDSKRLVLSR